MYEHFSVARERVHMDRSDRITQEAMLTVSVDFPDVQKQSFWRKRQRKRRKERYSHPSSSLAMTMPLPALAENRKPALKIVKIAKPLAFSRMVLGIT